MCEAVVYNHARVVRVHKSLKKKHKFQSYLAIYVCPLLVGFSCTVTK